MTKDILLTGSTGFVGRQVLNYLARQDVLLTVIVRDGKQAILKDYPFIKTVIVSSDIFAETEEWWTEAFKGIDTAIHVAWYAEPGNYLQSAKNVDCLRGTLSMAKGAVKAGLRRFVGIGTCFEYDISLCLLSVDSPLKPLTPYAGAKAAAYMALANWLPTQSVEFAWCRLFYLFGEGEDNRRLVPYLRNRLAVGEPAELTSGKQIRDYIDVNEAGSLIGKVALSIVQGPINICSGIPITVRQFAERIADEYGRRDLLRFGARLDNHTDPSCVVGIRSELPC